MCKIELGSAFVFTKYLKNQAFEKNDFKTSLNFLNFVIRRTDYGKS